MIKSKGSLKENDTGHQRGTQYISYDCCKPFENTWMREWLRCLGALRLNGEGFNGHLCHPRISTQRQPEFEKDKKDKRRYLLEF